MKANVCDAEGKFGFNELCKQWESTRSFTKGNFPTLRFCMEQLTKEVKSLLDIKVHHYEDGNDAFFTFVRVPCLSMIVTREYAGEDSKHVVKNYRFVMEDREKEPFYTALVRSDMDVETLISEYITVNIVNLYNECLEHKVQKSDSVSGMDNIIRSVHSIMVSIQRLVDGIFSGIREEECTCEECLHMKHDADYDVVETLKAQTEEAMSEPVPPEVWISDERFVGSVKTFIWDNVRDAFIEFFRREKEDAKKTKVLVIRGDAGVGKSVLAALIICYKIYEIRCLKALSNASDAPIHCREIMERPYIRNILMDMVGSMPCLRDDYSAFMPVFSYGIKASDISSKPILFSIMEGMLGQNDRDKMNRLYYNLTLPQQFSHFGDKAFSILEWHKDVPERQQVKRPDGLRDRGFTVSYLTLNAKSVKDEADTRQDDAEKAENTGIYKTDEPIKENQSAEEKLLNDKEVEELSHEIELLSIISEGIRHVQNLYSFLTDGICCGEEYREKCGLNLCDELNKKVGSRIRELDEQLCDGLGD